MVSKVKWLEPRHTVNVTDRFTRDKTDSLQHAFFNGEGYATLENLWGFWYGMTPRDAETVLRITKIERAFPQNLSSADWEPHVPTLQAGVFASTFPTANSTLWTIVNRNEYDVTGEELRVPAQPGTRYFDLWHGVELFPRANGDQASLAFTIDALGFGAVFAATENAAASGSELQALLRFMASRSTQPLTAYSRQWKFVPQTILSVAATRPPATPPSGMLRIPEADYDFAVQGIEIEGGDDPGVDVQYPWEDAPRRFHRRRMHISAFYIDRTPVTNQQFKEFLDATKYHPPDSHNFLRDWKNGTYPEGWSSKPVTWVSIEDARAYAAWAGKRLPHEWEWQYAAQSTDGRTYPWGNDWHAQAVPPPITVASCARRQTWMRIPTAQAPSGSSTSKATSHNGRMNFAMSTRARPSCAAELPINPAAPSGISRKPIASISTRNFCSCRPAATVPAPSASAAL
jgi:hypothetical protein